MAIDATVGGASADSYLTVAEADAIAGNRIGPYADKWLDAAVVVATKERALKTATRDVDEHIGGTLKYSAAQALAFPRSGDVDSGLNAILLPAVREATWEQAVYLLVNARELADAATRRARAMFNFTEDAVSGSVTIDPVFGRFSPDAGRLLASLPGEAAGGIDSVPLRSMAWADSQGQFS